MAMRYFLLGSLISVVFLAAGCMAEAESEETSPEDEEELGEAEEAFSGIASFSTTAVGSTAINSGAVSTDAQAFLSAVVGNFARSGTLPPAAEVRSSKSNPTTFAVLAVPASSGATIGGTGYAVSPGQDSTVQVRQCSHSGAGSQSVSLDVPTGDYFCFLNRVANTATNGFNSWDDKAEIDHSTNPPTLTCHNDSSAWASCIPITNYLGAVSAGDSGVSTSSNLGPVDNVNGKVCGLYAINGTFRTNSASNGVRAYVSGSNWYFATSAGKGGNVACVY